MSTASHFNIKSNRALYTTGSLLFATSGFLVLGLLCPTIADNSYADSDSTSMDVSASLEPTLSISTDVDAVNLAVNPSDYESLVTGDVNVNVSTNNPTGYTLSIASSSSETALVNKNNSNITIPTLSSETTATAWEENSSLNNKWGFTHNNTELLATGTYLPIVAANEDNKTTIKTTSSPANSSNTTVTFATKVDSSQAGGEYDNTIVISAVANEINVPIKDDMYMQDVTPEMCNDSGTLDYDNDGKTYTLKDKRLVDGVEQTYKVRKLADGRCWMVENLYLDGDMELTPEDSDIDGTTTLTQPDGSTATNKYKLPASSTAGFIGATQNMYAGSKSTGSYLTWNVATAGEGAGYSQGPAQSTTNSICPKNWKLPYSDGSDTTTNGFYALYSKYDSASAFIAPFNFTAVRFYYNGSRGNISRTYWWSSRSPDAKLAYLMYMGSNVSPANNSGKHNGFSVRCVLPAE